MDFNLSEETDLLKKSAERFLQEKCPSSLLRELIQGEDGYSKDLWKEMVNLGWLGLIHDEAYGGFGGNFFDLFILFEEIGKAQLPSPFFCSAVLSGLTINEAGDDGQKEAYLPAIIDGTKICTLALLDDQGQCDADDPKIEALKGQDNAFLISGTRLLVPYAHIADNILLCAKVKDSGNGGPTIFMVDGRADGLEKAYLNTMTEEKTHAVTCDNVKVSADNIIGAVGKGNVYLNAVLPKATVLKCGEMLGGLDRITRMTIDYMKERNQFGRPLGTLQAVHHFCADMATYLETSRLLTYQAAYLLSEGVPCDKEISMAKAWCNEAYRKSTWIAHQLHGGIGFTEEYDLHFYYKHAKASELAFEGSWFHRGKVADALGI